MQHTPTVSMYNGTSYDVCNDIAMHVYDTYDNLYAILKSGTPDPVPARALFYLDFSPPALDQILTTAKNVIIIFHFAPSHTSITTVYTKFKTTLQNKLAQPW
jgi:hypothetical protein